MSLAAPSEEKLSVDEYLTNFIKPHVKEEFQDKLHSAVREALKNTAPNSLAVLWTRENVVTRLSFWDFGTEFLFIWYGTEQNFFAIEKIFELLISIANQLASSDLSSIFEEFTDTSNNEVFTMSMLASRHKVSINKLKKTTVSAINAGLIEPVYRLNTQEFLQEIPNEWVEDLSSLKQVFTSESGVEVDGRNPSNIEVGFRKIIEEGR